MKNNSKSNIELLRISLDVIVILIMAFGLYVALSSNKTSTRALQAQYVPWVDISNISTSFEKETFFVSYGIQNFSSAPALNIKAVMNIGNISSSSEKSSPDSLLPGKFGKYGFTIQGSSEVNRMYKEVMKGDVPIKFIITYSDIFGNNFNCITQTRYDGKDFRNDSFEVNGVENLLN